MLVLSEELLGTPEVSSTNSIPGGFCSQKLWRLIFLALEPGLEGLVWGWDSSLLGYPSQIFNHHTWMWDQPIHISVPPTNLGGCGLFNSIVVELPFNLISDSYE